MFLLRLTVQNALWSYQILIKNTLSSLVHFIKNSAMRIAILYLLFAGMSTLINISTQMLWLEVYKGAYAIESSILVGTLIGLPLRYILEKRYIFTFKSKNINQNAKVFLLYNIMGVFTTIIFWGFEYSFHLIFLTNKMRYLGAAIGLFLGYFIKYQLDKRYVFVHKIPR